MREEEGIDVEFRHRPREVDGHVGRAVFRGEVFWVGDVLIVVNTAVFCILHVVGIVDEVRVVAVVAVGSKHRAVEVRRSLPLIVAAPVEIVEFEAHAEFLAGVHAEEGGDAVFAVRLIAAAVVSEIGERRLCICKKILVRLFHEKIKWLGEDKGILHHRGAAQAEDARLTRRAEVARRVVFAVQPLCERLILEQMRRRVGINRPNVAETLVDAPHLHLYRDICLFYRVFLLHPMLSFFVLCMYRLRPTLPGKYAEEAENDARFQKFSHYLVDELQVDE